MTDSTASSRLDRAGDLACVLVSAAGGLILLITRAGGAQGAAWLPGAAPLLFGLDAGIGVLASALLWFRRRWPTGVAVAMVLPMILARSAQLASLVAVFNVALRRRPAAAVAVAAAHQVAFIGFSLLWITYPWWVTSLWVLTYHVALVSLGLYARARRGLVASLHEQVRRAEAAKQLMAEQARQAERARIAVEMHDVLAHRVSLMALHAGALEVRPDLTPGAVRETAGLIRLTARQALAELRDVIGVLHDAEHAETPYQPPPRLGDLAGLVSGYRQAGLEVELDMQVEEPDVAPGPLGRDAYRIVREALTNVSKHAAGAGAAVSLSGGPGTGLRVTVRNMPAGGPRPAPSAGERKLMNPARTDLPGAGLGLVSLTERVTLAGGTLTHGPDDSGGFVLAAVLRWED